MTRKRKIQAAVAGTAVALIGTLVYVAQEDEPQRALDKTTGVDWYTSPTGGGNGTQPTQPTTLQALVGDGSPVQPGGIINVGPGTYPCAYSSVGGTAAAPIIVKGEPGAVLDGATCTRPEANSGANVLYIAGTDTHWRDLEIADSNPDKFNPDGDSNPTFARPNGVSVVGARTKIINLFIHDTGGGIGLWGPAADSEVYGTVIARAGWASPNGGKGHGIYVQSATGVQKINNTITLDAYNNGIHAYATAGFVKSVYVDGLIAAHSGKPVSGGGPDRNANALIGTEQNPTDDVRITNSVFYQDEGANGGVRAGYGVPGIGVSITNSDMVGGSQALDLKNWEQATVTGNTFHASAGGNRNAADILAYVSGVASATWDNNTYFDETWPNSDGVRTPFAYNGTTGPDGSQLLSWQSWRLNSGYDANSGYMQGTPLDKVIVQPNAYEQGRSNVVVLNWTRQPTRTVDLGGGAWTVYDANNMQPIATGSGPVVIPTPNEFGAFIVRSATTPVPPTTTTTTSTVPATTTTTSTTVPSTTTTHPVNTTTVPVTTAPPTTPPPTIAPTTTTRPPCKKSWWEFWKCR